MQMYIRLTEQNAVRNEKDRLERELRRMKLVRNSEHIQGQILYAEGLTRHDAMEESDK
jgi:hypothetical protein